MKGANKNSEIPKRRKGRCETNENGQEVILAWPNSKIITRGRKAIYY
jgi:hypothetical protein